MIETKDLLERISALRHRLDVSENPTGTSTALLEPDAVRGPDDPLARLQQKVDVSTWETLLIDNTLRPLSEPAQYPVDTELLPTLLTSRGVRLLKRGKELLNEMRRQTEDVLFPSADDQAPLNLLQRELICIAEAVVRTVQAFPAAPSAQMRLCEGLEGILALVDQKLNVVKSGLNLRRKEQRRIELLAEALENAVDGSSSPLAVLTPLAEELIAEAREGHPLRFLHAPPSQASRFVAAHCLTVAQVILRVIVHDPTWRDQLGDVVVMTCLHNAGMLNVPIEILAKPGPLEDNERRIIEKHPMIGGEIASRLWPTGGPLGEAIRDHHERIDGTGYPAGRTEPNLGPLTRLLAACDVYAALCSPRPYRPALDTRAALTDTLLLADQGFLDRAQAQRLLTLSFHPVGSVVELSDGCLAVVVAVHEGQESSHPARPVVFILTDPHGLPLPIPRHLDLAKDEHRSVVRSMPPQERRDYLLTRYPELA